MMRFAIILSLLPFAAYAEPQPAVAELMHYMDVTAPCLEAATDRAEAAECIGQGSGICMETEDGGFSTVGMMFCTLAEYEAWDRVLNIEYGRTMDGLGSMDQEDMDLFPEYAQRADWLLKAQRAWIPLRDAQCALEYAMWGPGSMRQIAGASCLLDMTADRTIYLRFLGSEMRG